MVAPKPLVIQLAAALGADVAPYSQPVTLPDGGPSKLIDAMGTDGSEDALKAWTQFAAFFLLPYVQHLQNLNMNKTIGDAKLLLVLPKILDLSGGAHISRFCRDRPTSAMALYYACLKAVGWKDSDFPKVCEMLGPSVDYLEDLEKALDNVISDAKYMAMQLLHALHSNLPHNPTSNEFLQSRTAELGLLGRDTLEHEEVIGLVCEKLLNILPGERAQFGPWWECQYSIAHNAADPPVLLRCVQGEDHLRQCARCRTVRYCSEEHQKADWKEHKPTCREPAWGVEE